MRELLEQILCSFFILFDLFFNNKILLESLRLDLFDERLSSTQTLFRFLIHYQLIAMKLFLKTKISQCVSKSLLFSLQAMISSQSFVYDLPENRSRNVVCVSTKKYYLKLLAYT